MALSVSSARVFNANVGRQGYLTSSTCTKCICCPYGYHIDLDFVRYCEAVAAGSAGDRMTIERRKKKERRRQCQSMEFLLGLVSPDFPELVAENLKASETVLCDSGITTLPKVSCTTSSDANNLSGLDLSDVVCDFEATLKHSSKTYGSGDRNEKAPNDDTDISIPVQVPARLESTGDCDDSSVGSGNSNLSTGTLQNIREQMAASLERMKELEQQVKAIPMLQVQVSVLQEEKRNLLQQVHDFNRSKFMNDTFNMSRSHSFSEDRFRPQKARNSTTPTRDMGTSCVVMTRDVGVSHQQIRTRDVGVVTNTPIQRSSQTGYLLIKDNITLNSLQDSSVQNRLPSITPKKLERSHMQIEYIMPSFTKSVFKCSKTTQSDISLENIQPLQTRKNYLNKSLNGAQKFRDFGVNTERRIMRPLQQSIITREEILPEKENEPNVTRVVKMRSKETITSLKGKDILTADDIAVAVKEALSAYKESQKKTKVSKESQCTIDVSNKQVQTSELFRLRTSIGVTAKPRTCDAGTEIKEGPSTKSIAVGPDPVATHSISLNSMNSRSYSFNYGDTKPKRVTTKSVGVVVDDLIKTTTRSTDTSGLVPKSREFGTSPLRKKFTDVSVGESVKPHITISCAANYCDNCKETINNLAKQISSNMENHATDQNTVSRIPRPSNIVLNISDNRRQFKRQDTYTKIPIGVIKYDSDNKDQYENNLRLQKLESIKLNEDKPISPEVHCSQKEIENEEKYVLPDSSLFQPIQEKPRQKIEPSKEMRAAMKVLNDNLKKSHRNISYQIKSANNIIQQEWFKISSTANANPLDVEDYLDCFEECSSSILEYIVNLTDSSGNTAMHYAVSHGNFDVVSILLDSKVCDINKANTAGYTAIMLAALADVRNSTHASVAKRLFQNADVNIRAKLHGQTALMLAVSHGRKDMTQLLLDAGAAINIQDEDGSTALMCAAEHGHADIVRLLLAHPDCDPSITDVDGSSALKIALEAGNRDIGVLLYAHEHVNRGTSPYSSIRRSRRSSKPTTPTGSCPSAPVSPAASRRFHSSMISLNASKYSGK